MSCRVAIQLGSIQLSQVIWVTLTVATLSKILDQPLEQFMPWEGKLLYIYNIARDKLMSGWIEGGLINFKMLSSLSLVPRPHLPNDRKAGGGPGTFWHVTDVKLRRHGRGFPLAKRCTNARLRDRAQKSERRRVLARGRYKDQDYQSWSLPLAKTPSFRLLRAIT